MSKKFSIKNSKLITRLLMLGIIIGAYLFITPIHVKVNQVVMIFTMADLNVIKGYILSFGPWAPAISFLLMIFQSIMAPLPAFLITFANAGLFGWV